MAIAPPTDLVLDVVKAAEPQALQQATAKLARLAKAGSGGGPSALAFADNLSAAERDRFSLSAMSSNFEKSRVEAKASQSPAEKFEALILHQFVETMLPDEAGSVFGEGATGEIWKSMLAEQVGNQIAASGGVGIADLLSDTLRDQKNA